MALLLAPAVCDATREHLIQGRTMGTTYHIKVVTGKPQTMAGLKERIDARLVAINNSMSTYQKDSEISRFNDLKQLNEAFEISNDFYRVMLAAKTIFELSEGAWDGTVNPLVDLWGFGRAGRKRTPPPKEEIAALLPNIGFDQISISQHTSQLKKKKIRDP